MTSGRSIFLLAGVLILALLFVPAFPWGMNAFQFLAVVLDMESNIRLNERADRSKEDLDKIIGQLLKSIEASGGNKLRLRRAVYRYEGLMANRMVPTEIANNHAAQLVSIFRRQGAVLESIGGSRNVELLSTSCGTPEAREFLVTIISGPGNQIRRDVIYYLNWTTTWVGDAKIFDALESLFMKEGDPDRVLLAAMQKIDNARSLRHIEGQVLKAKGEDELMKISGLIARANDERLAGIFLKQLQQAGSSKWGSLAEIQRYWAPRSVRKKSEQSGEQPGG